MIELTLIDLVIVLVAYLIKRIFPKLSKYLIIKYNLQVDFRNSYSKLEGKDINYSTALVRWLIIKSILVTALIGLEYIVVRSLWSLYV